MEGKSAFKLMQAHGPQAFGASPSSSKSSHVETELALVLDGKKVHNAGEVLEQIEGRVGRGEVELGSCALCYEDGRREGLVLPCGRSGCAQRVDGGCLSEWVRRPLSFLDISIIDFSIRDSTERALRAISCTPHNSPAPFAAACPRSKCSHGTTPVPPRSVGCSSLWTTASTSMRGVLSAGSRSARMRGRVVGRKGWGSWKDGGVPSVWSDTRGL